MRLKIAYCLPCLCNSEGPTLVNTTVFDPFVRFENSKGAQSASRSQLEIRVEDSSRADCRFAQHVRDIDILRCDAKEFGGRIQSKNFVVGFPDSRRTWEMRRSGCKVGLLKALA